MSLPAVQTQRSFFETDVQFARLFKDAPADHFDFFSKTIMPQLQAFRPQLEKMYCRNNGRPAEEPVRMLAILILQFMEGHPDRKTVEACTYDLRWKMALWMEADEPSVHATSLVKFRNRLAKHDLVKLGFDAVLEAMRTKGYLKNHKTQRLDSTHVLGLVSHMSRLECVRETLRLALEVLAQLPEESRPEAWPVWWERYVESTLDYRTDGESLKQKMTLAGQDARAVLAWVDGLPDTVGQMKSIVVLRRVFEENFTVADDHIEKTRAQPPGAVHNPHDPEAQWSTKGTIAGQNKEWVGYKAQIAETLPSPSTQNKTPTDAVITAVVTQPAITSDHGSIKAVEQEWEGQGLDKPEELYVDGGYTSGSVLAEAAAEGREVHGPIQSAPRCGKRFTSEDFDVKIEECVAVCPSEHASTNCSRLEEEATGKVSFRFEWNNSLCQQCPNADRCLGAHQRHRTLTVGEHHQFTQDRRKEMKTDAYRLRMHKRNGVEGTISELKRGYGLRRCRYRGLVKTGLQNYLIAGACNIKRWARRLAWESTTGHHAGDQKTVWA